MSTRTARAVPKSKLAGAKPRAVSSIRPTEQAVSRAHVWQLAGLCALLAVATLALYARAGSYPFVNYDDPDYVVENSHVKAGLSWQTLAWAATATEGSNWHPVTWISHALDYQLYGLNAAGHHWTSILIHVVNVILLFLLLYRVTGALGRSLLVAALFALHPINVEGVAWVAERKNVLSTMFLLLTCGAYGWYARRPSVGRYGLVAVFLALGLASKPMLVTLPFALLLLDWWPLQRVAGWIEPSSAFPVPQCSWLQLLLEKLPLLALSAATSALTVVAQTVSLIPTVALPFTVRLQTALYAYALYVGKLFWPASLAAIYPHPGRNVPALGSALGLLLIVGVGLLAWRQRENRPYLAVGWFWFLGTLVPVIGLVQVGAQLIADRFAYVPFLGLFVMIVWGAADVANQYQVSSRLRTATAVFILLVLSVLTWRQVSAWQSSLELWTHAVNVTRDNSVAENNLANTLFALQRYPEGMAHLREYARLEPLDPAAHARVGADFDDHGQLNEAAKEFEIAIRGSETLRKAGLPPMEAAPLAVTYANLSVVYGLLGDYKRADENIKQAVQISPDAVEDMLNRLAQSIAAHPSATGFLRLGLLLNGVGQAGEAQQAFARAHELDPSLVQQAPAPR